MQLPGASFVNPEQPLRDALTREGTERALAISALGQDFRPFGRLIDERAIVNAVVALMATGGSTNHTIHWIAVARAAGIVLTWDDMDLISQTVPLLTRVYPNGEADVNRFQAAGGTAFVFRELMDAGYMHDDLPTVVEGGMRAYANEPRLQDGKVIYVPGTATSADDSVARPVSDAFESQGGLRLLRGNLGRSLIKLSAVKPQHRKIEAPAVVIDTRRCSTSCMRPVCCRMTSWWCCVTRARVPTVCRSCIQWPRCSACCRTRAVAWRWSPTAVCPVPRASSPPRST